MNCTIWSLEINDANTVIVKLYFFYISVLVLSLAMLSIILLKTN